MTEEKIKQKAKEYAYTMAIYYESNHGRKTSQLEKYLRNAYITGAEENGIRWHKVADEDFPDTDRLVYVQTKNNDTGIAYFYNGVWYSSKVSGIVVAWCEKPTFNET